MNGRSDCDAIHEYVRDNAALAGALLDCGESFPRCLEQFPAVDALPYLPDLARFEWAREVALGAPQLAIDRSAPRNIGEADTLDACVAFHPSLSFIETMWPIDDIWEAGRTAGGRLPAISATTRTIRVLVFRRGATAGSMRLTHARMSFMQALRCGNSVRDAAALALRADDRFDPLIILGDLFKRGLIVELIPAGQRP